MQFQNFEAGKAPTDPLEQERKKLDALDYAVQNIDPDHPRMPEFQRLTVEARRIIEAWKTDYNTLRPHTSLNGLTPTEFAARPTEGHNQNRLSP